MVIEIENIKNATTDSFSKFAKALPLLVNLQNLYRSLEPGGKQTLLKKVF